MSGYEEKYRKRTFLDAAPSAAPAAAMEMLKAAARDEYKAYHSTAHPELELWIRPNAANDWTDVYLPYSYRNHMISDGSGFVVSMHYNTPVISVTIHGRNLRELVHLLSKRQVEWLAEYDPRIFPELAADAPCITGIEIKHAPRPARSEDSLPGEKDSEMAAPKH